MTGSGLWGETLPRSTQEFPKWGPLVPVEMHNTWLKPLGPLVIAPGELPVLSAPCCPPWKAAVIGSSTASAALEVLPESALEHLTWSEGKGDSPLVTQRKGARSTALSSPQLPSPSAPVPNSHVGQTDCWPRAPAAGGAAMVITPWEI